MNETKNSEETEMKFTNTEYDDMRRARDEKYKRIARDLCDYISKTARKTELSKTELETLPKILKTFEYFLKSNACKEMNYISANRVSDALLDFITNTVNKETISETEVRTLSEIVQMIDMWIA